MGCVAALATAAVAAAAAAVPVPSSVQGPRDHCGTAVTCFPLLFKYFWEVGFLVL